MSIIVRKICNGRRALLFALGASASAALGGCEQIAMDIAGSIRPMKGWEDRTLVAGSLWENREEVEIRPLHDEDQPRYPEDFAFETSTPLVTIIGHIDVYYQDVFDETPAVLMIDASDFPHNARSLAGVAEFELIRFSSGQWFVASIFAGQRDIVEFHHPGGFWDEFTRFNSYIFGCRFLGTLQSSMSKRFFLDLTEVKPDVPVYIGHFSFYEQHTPVFGRGGTIDVVVQDRATEFEAKIESLVDGMSFVSKPAIISESCS
jgi:hypothetical protein